ncbi:MAG: 50S ribosomal protein L35ae [Candidatus Nanoarchaeia archaeon]|nr:50S ribosomal protein L35ae [Candidatus Nanoarchaeia archaeon]
MEGKIINYRRGKRTQTTNQMIIVSDDAKDIIGKDVVYTTEANREIKGKVSAKHGNKNAFRVIFEKGMPGQAIGKNVNIKN